MKLALLINSLAGGGAEKLVCDLALNYSQKKIDFDIIVLTDYEQIFHNTITKKGINIITLSHGKQLFSVKLLLRLAKILENYTTVHAHLFPSEYYASICGFLQPNLNVITTIHYTSTRRRTWMYRYLEKAISSRVDTYISISSSVENEAAKWLPEIKTKSVMINNGINIELIENAPRFDRNSIGFNENDFIILMTARFNKLKDHATLIKAISLLPAKYKLALAGTGEEISSAINLCDELNISHRVSFLGFFDNIPSLLKTCDVAVLSSHSEGLPLSSIEAMAAGIPFLGSDIPTIREVVGRKQLLFNYMDPEDLARKIKMTCENSDFRSESILYGKKRVKLFSIDKIADRHIDLYFKNSYRQELL
ncbi:MAG: glycosyltransferase [Deltaproteobacteria bacterium]|nr:glycosyltransferase [Deltaproteobacteria bacterium]